MELHTLYLVSVDTYHSIRSLITLSGRSQLSYSDPGRERLSISPGWVP